MISNHYGFLYGAPNNWLVLVLVMLAGALIRHSFVVRHLALVAGKRVPWEYAAAGVLMLAGVVGWLMPAPQTEAAQATPASFAQVQSVVVQRCLMCHGDQLASKGLNFATAAAIEQHAQQIYQQAVVQKTMPLNNATQMTEAERNLLGRWFKAGAPAQ